MFTINHNHTSTVKIEIEIKSLDRLVDYLEANDQKVVDELTKSVTSATGKLTTARALLKQAVDNSPKEK